MLYLCICRNLVLTKFILMLRLPQIFFVRSAGEYFRDTLSEELHVVDSETKFSINCLYLKKILLFQ